MSSAWPRANCAPGRRFVYGATRRRPRPPYRTDGACLFVCFVANAECACHLALGWPLPQHVLDLSPAFRNLVNGRSTPEGKGLSAPCAITARRHRRQAERRHAKRVDARLAIHAGRAAADPGLLRQRRDALVRLLPQIWPTDSISASRFSRRIRRGIGADGAQRRPDRHERFSASLPTRHLARSARCHGAGDRRAIRRLRPQAAATGISTWSASKPISRAKASGWPLLETGKLNCSARPSRT